MTMKTLLLRFLLLLAPLHAVFAAESLAPGQFAQGFAIEATAGGALHRLLLDERVYRTLQRQDLGDLVVFNGAGEAVPQTFEAAQAPAQPALSEQPLPFYPVREDVDAQTRGGLRVSVDASGAVVSIEADATDNPGAAGGDTATSWIVDTGEPSGALRGLRLEWATDSAPFARTATLYASSDLLGWQYLVQGTLAELTHGAHRLRQDTLAFHGASARFLRLDWSGAGEPPQLLTVLGQRSAAAQPLPLVYASTRAYRADTTQPGWQFETGGPFPLSRLRVQLPGEDNLVDLRLLSRPHPDAAWIERGRALAWRLGTGETVLESPEIELPPVRDRHWRLESPGNDAHALGDAPEILFGWLPDAVLFVTRGSGPFLLAAGSATAMAVTQPLGTLVATLEASGHAGITDGAYLGAQHELGGERALRAPTPPVPWQRYLMWVLLVGGVLVLLRMAVSLLRPAA